MRKTKPICCYTRKTCTNDSMPASACFSPPTHIHAFTQVTESKQQQRSDNTRRKRTRTRRRRRPFERLLPNAHAVNGFDDLLPRTQRLDAQLRFERAPREFHQHFAVDIVALERIDVAIKALTQQERVHHLSGPHTHRYFLYARHYRRQQPPRQETSPSESAIRHCR